MPNPAGNYPGRQIFLGGTKAGHPAFVYLVTGRSQPSQQRVADRYNEREKSIRISPVDPAEGFDPFRHYQAVKIWTPNGVLVVSNNQATVDPVLEGYALMTDQERASSTLLWKQLNTAGPEYDNPDRSKCTSRITGVVFPVKNVWRQALGIVTERGNPSATVVRAHNIRYDGRFDWISTYNGEVDYANFENPERLQKGETVFEFSAETAQGLADELFEMTDYEDPTYGILRVCTIAGVRNGNGPGDWELARKNKHKL